MKYSVNGEQYHLGIKNEDIGEYVILPGDPKRCKKIAAYFDDAGFVADRREFTTYTGYLDGVKVSVTSTGIGGPSAAIAIEELVAAGAKTFIRIGTCGGIKMDVKSGDIIIATGSVRMEGTSRQYAPIEFPAVADFEIVNALRDAAAMLGATSHTGIVQSKDSFYGEHEPERMPVGYELLNKWDAWKKLGVLGSEMESAALFTAGSALGARVGAVFLVMANQEREAAGLDNPVAYDTDLAVRVAVGAMKKLIKQEKEN